MFCIKLLNVPAAALGKPDLPLDETFIEPSSMATETSLIRLSDSSPLGPFTLKRFSESTIFASTASGITTGCFSILDI